MAERKNIKHSPFAADFPRSVPWRGVIIALCACGLALALIPFSESVWRAVYATLRSDWLPLDDFWSSAKQLAVGSVIISICIIIWVFDRPRRPAIIVFLVAILFAGGFNQVLKHSIRRARPQYSILLEDKEKRWMEKYLEEHPGAPIIVEVGDQWLTFTRHFPFDNRFASFPSGHTIAAFVLAAFLCALYPRLNWLWLLWAAGCGLARVRYRQHYPEDILMGGGLGWIIAQFFFAWPWLARFGDKIARALSRKAA
ncbi:MAG: phosphatase PAP2 family protein [Candidatus Sumerlaeia bacterium]